MTARYRPTLGALPEDHGVRFRVWAPAARAVDLVVERSRVTLPLSADGSGYFERFEPALRPGDLYRYRVDGGPAWPDPASRFQPEGVHGPSMIVDPGAYVWQDAGWTPPRQPDLVFYELHVGTFTPEGTFAAVRDRLPYLASLGVTAVELMPVAEFPGRWNWGYDPAAFFAPSHTYGAPDDLRALVDDAHRTGLAVFLDVIYNHFGPDGAYAPAFSQAFFAGRHRTPWGPAINLDGEGATGVRRFFVENALHWLAEYHVDGLRLDATHALVDESPVHFLRDLAEAVRGLGGLKRYVVAEDHRNLKRLLLPPDAGGYGLDAVWSDDYHHQMRRILAGDRDGYFSDFAGSTRDLAATIERGWLFSGQHSMYFGGPRGTDPSGIPPFRFVHFLQNHDQIGNRAEGERLTAGSSGAAFRAAVALLLFAPELPLLFMGQEWTATTPFRYFTDHTPDLGVLVREGRRREFARFAGFAGAIPDPQDPGTFAASRLRWTEQQEEPHAAALRLHRDLLAYRRELSGGVGAESPIEGGLVLRRGAHVLLAALRTDVTLPLPPAAEILWHTEQPQYAADAMPPRTAGNWMTFLRPGAVAVRVGPA
jgi:maltooligosyltrehalose trehalohydrolase